MAALTAQQAADLGLPPEGPPQAASKALSREEAQELGLPPDGPAAARAGPSKMESLGRGAAQGATFGLGDEIQGVIQAAGQKILPDSLGGSSSKKSFAQLRQEAVQGARLDDARAKAENPWSYGLGEVGGGALSSVLIPGGPVAPNASRAAKLVQLGKTGAILGGANAFGHSEAEGADLLKDTATGAAVGGALAPAISWGADKAIRSSAPLLERLSDKLKSGAIAQGRRVLTGGAEPLSVKNPIADSSVIEAFKQGAFKPLGNTQKAADVLANAREDVGGLYRQILTDLEAKGVTGPAAKKIADQMTQRGADLAKNSLGTGVPELYAKQAGELLEKAPGGTLGLTQAENIKRSLQDAAKYGGFQETLLNKGRRDIASMVRQGVEDSIEAQAGKAPEAAAAFVPVKQQLSRLIEAADAAEKGVAQAARRKTVSFGDTMMAAGGMAHGGPLGAGAAALGNNLLRNRGTSTAAWGLWQGAKAANAGANLAEKMAAMASDNHPALGKFGPILLNAARRSPDALAATHYSMSTDPEYQEAMRAASTEETP